MNKILFVCLALFSGKSFSNDSMVSEQYSGLFVNYPGTEYEATFMPCDMDDIWRISKSEKYYDFLSVYNNVDTNEYGEVYLKIDVIVNSVDMDMYPSSHFSAFLDLLNVIEYSTDPSLVDNCRKLEAG
ncbi:hypothetical protein N9W78_00025 [bacterium]|nr:hypothetical protein [bacterium]